jgi:uncharacterized Zn-binding protein involved in type VI secretion
MSVSVNPPKTPVTEGSQDVAAATLPNVCKMPGPPAPFVPTPLPNIGKSGDNLKKCTSKVLFEGKKVAIEGSFYKSMGDMASKGTGGGLVSAATHGKTKFVAPGSMNVKAEGKNIQLLGDAMTNNGGSPANAATAPGNVQVTDAFKALLNDDALALALCKAACAAKKAKGKGKKRRFQNMMRKFLDPKNSKGVRGAGLGFASEVTSGRILTEVAVRGGTVIGKWGAAGAGAGVVGGIVKWDIVLANPASAVLGGLTTIAAPSVLKIIEVKFTDLQGKLDTLTDQQQLAKDAMTDAEKEKYQEMDVEKSCICP